MSNIKNRLSIYQPEIPGNIGSLMRLSACWGFFLDIIRPTGFVFHDKYFKRSSMDYFHQAFYQMHDSWEDYIRFLNDYYGKTYRTIGLVCQKGISYHNFSFQKQDVLVLGCESSGLPLSIQNKCDQFVHIPMRDSCRSLNMAMAAGIVMGEVFKINQHFDAF